MKRRIPILSFILSLLVMGLGQVYNGELKKGIAYLVIIFPVYLLIGLTGVISNLWGFASIILIIMVYKIVISVEAFRTSKRLGNYSLKPINKTWKYVLFAIFGYFVIWYGSKLNKELIGYEDFQIPTSSMEPSIMVGDRIVATKISPEKIELGDIITFTQDDGQKYLCRVVALPNQELTIRNDQVVYSNDFEEWKETRVSLNDEFEYQEYLCTNPNGKTFKTKRILRYKGQELPKQKISNIDVQTVPSDKVFVMGDNRNNSMDSRMYGAINISDIDKKVNYILWGKSFNRIGIKLDE